MCPSSSASSMNIFQSVISKHIPAMLKWPPQSMSELFLQMVSACRLGVCMPGQEIGTHDLKVQDAAVGHVL